MNYKDLSPFRFWCQKVLPLVYDDSLSYYEILSKVVDYINKLIENNNNLNEGVLSVFEDLKALKELIEEYNYKVNSIVGGVMANTNGTPNVNYVTSIRKADDVHNRVQGFTTDGVYEYVSFSSSGTEDTSVIIKLLNGVEISRIVGSFKHANSLTVDKENNKLYSADCLIKTSSGVELLSSISVIDLKTFTFERRIVTTLDNNNFAGVSFYKGELYGITDDGDLYTINTNNGEVKFVRTFPINEHTTTQSIVIDNNYLYFSFAKPNTIKVYELATGKLINNINLKNGINNNVVIGELEDFYIENNVVHFINSVYVNEYHALIGEFGLYKQLNSTNTNDCGLYVSTFIVDGADNSSTRITSNRFKTVTDALLFIKGQPSGKYRISLEVNSSDDIVLECCEGKQIDFLTNSYVYSGHVKILDGNFNFNGTWDCSSASDSNPMLYISNTNYGVSNVSLRGNVINGNGGYFINYTDRSRCDILSQMNYDSSSLVLKHRITRGNTFRYYGSSNINVVSVNGCVYKSDTFIADINGEIGESFGRKNINKDFTKSITINLNDYNIDRLVYGCNVSIRDGRDNIFTIPYCAGTVVHDFYIVISNNLIKYHVSISATSITVSAYKISISGDVISETPYTGSSKIVSIMFM